MASPNARMAALLQSKTYLNLPPREQRSWLRHAEKLGDRAAHPSQDKEFSGPKDCLQRLNNWGFIEGAVYVTRFANGSNPRTPNWIFACEAYGTETTNKHKLEERVIKDNEGEVLTHRQRDGYHKQKGCTIEYALSYKKVPRDKCRKDYIGK